MDFWEGEFLGPIWAHTDFDDRRHPGFHFFIGFIALVSFILVYFVPRTARVLRGTPLTYLLLTIFFIITLPFLAERYHRFSKITQLLILLLYALQYFLSWAFVLKSLAEASSVQSAAGLFFEFGEIANNFMAAMSDFFSFMGGISATLLGVVTGSLLMGLIGILLFIAAVYVPLLYFFLIKRLQRLVDSFVCKYFSKIRQTA